MQDPSICRACRLGIPSRSFVVISIMLAAPAWLTRLACRHGVFKPASDTLALTSEQADQADAAPGELLRIRIAVLQNLHR